MRAITCLMLGCATVATIAHARSVSGLSDLVGARAAGGETQLQARGYKFISMRTGVDRKWSMWWNRDQRQCVTVVTMDGRYASITESPAADCGHTEKGHDDRDWDRDRGYHPDIGYRPTAPSTTTPSYAHSDEFVTADGHRFDLGLICFGDGQRPSLGTSYGWTWDSKRDRYRYSDRTELTTEQFDASIMIQLWGDGGRVKLPRKLVPPLHSGGNDGWWDLYDVSVQPDLIHAAYRLNGMNKPHMTIDRHSGRITIQGFGDYAFRGNCDIQDGQDRRRF